VWQELAGSHHDIHGALLTGDAQVVPVNGLGTFAIDTSGHDDVLPQVSTPSASGLLAVYQRTTSGNGDIAATHVSRAGAVLARGNLSLLENSGVRAGWPQHRPSVDFDGLRFGVAYHELYQNNPTTNDLDTRMSIVVPAGNELLVAESGSVLGFSSNREFHVEVAAAYSGHPSPSTLYGTTNDRDNTNGSFAIDVRTFRADPPDSYTTRGTGCGPWTIAASGRTRIGETLTFQVAAGGHPAGVLLGGPAGTPIAVCPVCTIGVAGSSTFGSAATLTIPNDSVFLGLALAAQGFVIEPSGAPCLDQISLTDTIDFRVW
jgi:hypothetical protein